MLDCLAAVVVRSYKVGVRHARLARREGEIAKRTGGDHCGGLVSLNVVHDTSMRAVLRLDKLVRDSP